MESATPEDPDAVFDETIKYQRYGRAKRIKNAFLRQVKQRLIERERPSRLQANHFNFH